MIYSDRRLPVVGELTDNIRNFDRDRLITFNEKYVYDGLIEDGSFPDFSNSFMVITGEMPQATYVKYGRKLSALHGTSGDSRGQGNPEISVDRAGKRPCTGNGALLQTAERTLCGK